MHTLQWHYDHRGGLSYGDCIKIIDEFAENKWGKILFTGDLKGIFKIIKYAREKKISVEVESSPNYLNHKTVTKLKELGISRYQLTIDGLPDENTIEAIHLLKQKKIPCAVMFSLCRENADKLIDALRVAVKEGAVIFDFSRVVSSSKEMLSPTEYRELLLKVLREYRHLQKKKKGTTCFGRKDPLWNLLYEELGLPAVSPCCAIDSILSISADGTVYPCRELPIKIGEVPQQSLESILINLPVLWRMRGGGRMKSRDYELCRGCPAVSYAIEGDVFAPDPQCWWPQKKL